MKLPEDGQILVGNFTVLHKFQHDVLQDRVGGWVGGWGSHRNVKMTS